MLAILDAAIAPDSSTVGASIGLGLLLSVNVALLVLNAEAWATLGGLVSWRRLGMWARISMALLLLCGWFAPPVVLWRLAVRAHRARQAELAAMPARIAQLKHELGLDRSRSE